MAVLPEGLSINHALYEHAKGGDLEKVKGAMDAGADINWSNPDEKGTTCLMGAIANETAQTRIPVVKVYW